MSNKDAFEKAARELGCSEDEARFDANLKRVARHKPQAAAKDPVRVVASKVAPKKP